jgi:hypothetical protein
MTSNTPVFSSPDLQKAMDAVRPALEGEEAARNRVSNDIKALEAQLESHKIKTLVRFSIGFDLEKPIDMEESEFIWRLSDFGTGPARVTETFLVWGPDANGRNRLLHEVVKCEGFFNREPANGATGIFPDPQLEFFREVRPLLECKFEVRKAMYEHLPAFVTKIGEALTIKPLDLPIEEIPF